MYVGLKQPRGDGERYVTPARAAAKETAFPMVLFKKGDAYNYRICSVNAYSIYHLRVY